MQWVVVPLCVFAFCFFVVGPILSGGPSKPSLANTDTSTDEPMVEPAPIEQGERTWTPVSPPQVSVTVTPLEDEVPPIEQFDDASAPPVIVPPGEGGADEAGVGGIAKPPTGEGEDQKAGDGRSMGSGVIGGDRSGGDPDDQGGVGTTTAGDGG